MSEHTDHRCCLTARHSLLLFLAILSPTGTVAAQDTLAVPPIDHGVRVIGGDTITMTFARAWKGKAAAVRDRRAAIAASLGTSYTQSDLVAQGASLTGLLHVLVLPGLYADFEPPHPPSRYRERLFGTGSGTVSVSQLYREMSGGVFDVDGDVLPWIKLPRVRAYYEGGKSPWFRLPDFLRDVLVLADDEVDFGDYDSDGPDGIPNSGDDDGYVDVVSFLYPSRDKHCLNANDFVGAHKGRYSGAQLAAGRSHVPFNTSDSAAGGGVIRVEDYIIESGVRCNGSLIDTGTFSHELGHVIDIPDLYDTNPNDGRNSNGIGVWGLMSHGLHNRLQSPAHMSAWAKDVLGWLSVNVIKANGVYVSLPPIQESSFVLRVEVPGSQEYFLLSNRQVWGSDAFLRGSGLLVFHIDPKVAVPPFRGNRVNVNSQRLGVAIEEADGLDQLLLRNSFGDGGDVFPGTSGTTSFTSGTHPSSRANETVSRCTVGLRSIERDGRNISLVVNAGERIRVRGDVDGDSKVGRNDVVAAYLRALDLTTGAPELLDGNVDDDDDVDIRDAFLIQSALAGFSIPVPPVGSTEVVLCDPAGA